MKMKRSLLLVGGLLATSASQAAVVGNLSATIDWDTLQINGVTMTPTSVTYMGDTFSSSEDVFLDYGYPPIADEKNSHDGVDVSVSYSAPDSSMNLSGSYSSTSNDSVAQVSMNNSSYPELNGFAGSYRNLFFTAETDGIVTFSVDYQVVGSISIDQTSYFEDYEWGAAGYEFLWEAFDATAILNGNPNPFATEDGTNGDALLAYLGCETSLEFPCLPSIDQTGTIQLTFDVTAGKKYGFGAEGAVWMNTQVNPIPVPAAVWLFGSGLLGLVGIARRKKA
mgnify:FL=1